MHLFFGVARDCRLVELGPRLTVDLLKVEQGIDEGEVRHYSALCHKGRRLPGHLSLLIE